MLVPLTGVLLVLGVPATGPAQAPGIGALKQKRNTLAVESRRALVELYGLESRLAQARAALDRVNARAAQLARREAEARARYFAAQRTLRIAQFQLGRQLRLLYQQDEPDPIAIVLGAASLDEAIDGLESVSRTARATKEVVAQSRDARIEVERTRRTLAAEAVRTSAVRASVVATANELEGARVERLGYVERLRRQESLTVSQISSLEQRAREARRRAAQIVEQRAAAAAEPTPADATPQPAPTAASPPAAPSEPPPAPVESVSEGQSAPAPPSSAPTPPRPGGTMTVHATGYCLRGTTATGLPVAPGIVAVDPTVIPLGTRMTIPGYGEGVAADVGREIKGARIDVWFASCAQAAGFTRTVAITFR